MAGLWGVISFICINTLLCLPSSLSLPSAGNVGCLFSKSLCDPEQEICVDDGVFGSCKQIFELDSDTPPFRYELSAEELASVTKEVETLFAEGYRWHHPATQCLLQTLLSSILTGREFSKVFCDTLRDREPRIREPAPLDQELTDVKNMAYIRYKPSEMDPNPEFADEIYSPPGLPEKFDVPEEEEEPQPEEEYLTNLERRSELPVLFSKMYNTPERFRTGYESRDQLGVMENLNEEPQVERRSGILFPDIYDDRFERRSGKLSNLNKEQINRRSGILLPDINEEQMNRIASISMPNLDEDQIDRRLGLMPDINKEQINRRFGMSMPDLNEEQIDRRSGLVLSDLNKEQIERRSGIQLSDLNKELLERRSGVMLPNLKEGQVERESAVQRRDNEEPDIESKLQEPLSHFRKHYNSPESFRDASHHHDAEEGEEMGVMRRSPAFDDSLDFDTDLDPRDPDLDLGGLMNPEEVISVKKELAERGSGFNEGGPLVLGPTRNDMNNLVAETNSDLSDLLDELDEWSFQRRERLDVKKPGPQFSTNNYAFQDTSTKKVQDSKNLVTKPSSKPAKVAVSQEGQKETMPSELPNHPLKAKIQSRTLWFQSILGDPHKKGVKSSHYSQHSAYVSPSKNSVIDNEQYDVVDTTYTYIEFKDSITTWKEGAHIVKTVAKLLDVPVELFSHQRMDRNEVTFKVVEPNDLGLNAYEVARRIDGIKDQLKKDIGVVVTSVGVGDKNKLPTAVKLNEREEQAYVVIVIVCGVLAALGLSAGVLYLTRRHGNKLANMTSSDTEPSKHYQDLCRARMSSKNGDSGSAVPPHRVASLSRESDNSPSSRSSTSSWSEEPVLSNMDVATGQLVLSYMEEHLKNKDRLELEWTALCAYKADPCATTVSEKEENKSKNRSETSMPYDHARVVLNELSNITGSDYINASTITDHDPRNPAYIVTQGPLPTTAPDFWQMVWEQGCVVIVMLTRLVENDTAMCHRYWPAEGSELYHIFEVHLVSEHIWCDDYLVRSFYLKNMKTGETRTVTQFHFLSWPEASVPQLTKPLLEFRRKVNKSFRGRSCPIVVHCSDGVGRSGTYCLLDMVLNRMAKGAKEIDVAATLEHIRDQRAGALATSQQFRFVLSSVSDELHAILRVHPQATQ